MAAATLDEWKKSLLQPPRPRSVPRTSASHDTLHKQTGTHNTDIASRHNAEPLPSSLDTLVAGKPEASVQHMTISYPLGVSGLAKKLPDFTISCLCVIYWQLTPLCGVVVNVSCFAFAGLSTSLGRGGQRRTLTGYSISGYLETPEKCKLW